MATNSYQSTKKAFTLIELLTVIAVIAILAGILIPVAGSVKKTALKTKTRSQFNGYITAFEQIKAEYGFYPTLDEVGVDPAVLLLEKSDMFYSVLTGRDYDTNEKIDSSNDARKYNRKALPFYTFSEGEIATATTALDFNNVQEGDVVDSFINNQIYFLVDNDRNGVINEDSINGSGGISPQGNTLIDRDYQGGVVFFSSASPSDRANLGYEFVATWE